jgi:mRNA deadenylase 3'-5' endonuclease subunit Ccr4
MECQIFIYNTHGLPWAVNNFKAICAWILELRPSVVCLQEVFVESTRKYYKTQLERCGYDVRIPNDYPVALLNSGLVTAVLRRNFTIVSECFCPYMDFHNVEWFANKGFHTLRLRSTASGRRIDILNTHTQSDTEVSWIFGREVTHQTRRQQIDQIVRFTEASRIPVLIAGDLNCEVSPHPHVRFLHPYTEIHLRKATFYHTGENLDHVAWLPLQWADPGCTFCDIERHGPRLVSCKVFEKPWSDHAPVLLTVLVPAPAHNDDRPV